MKANIFEIKRFAVHDGDGIRTTVFFKGCPLKCVWCHNPEGISFETELAYNSNKCISCGECVIVCPTKAHYFDNGKHEFNRVKCIKCGKCKDVCFGQALTLYGKEMSIDDIMSVILKDKDFYDNSNGGVTLSGGECLCQVDFCAKLLRKLKEYKIHTAIDTCGFIPHAVLDRVIPYTDVFLYDVKAVDEQTHIDCTSKSNKKIIENLHYLDNKGCKIEVRIPYVPNFNDHEIEKIGRLLSEINNLVKVRILPYHNFANSKYDSLEIRNTLPLRLPTNEEINKAKTILKTTIGKNIPIL